MTAVEFFLDRIQFHFKLNVFVELFFARNCGLAMVYAGLHSGGLTT